MKPLTAIIQANQLTRRAFICLAVDSPPPGSRVFALGQLMREEVSVFPKSLALSGFEVIAASLYILFRILFLFIHPTNTY